MAGNDEAFYQRLTRLFRTGPSVRRKIRGQDPKGYYDKSVVQNNLGYYGAGAFKREASPFSVMGAYGIIDRMSRYCLAGETLIALNTKEGCIRIDELAEKFKDGKPDKEYHTFSYDHETNTVVLGKITDAFMTKEDKAVEVHLDNGGIIRCTKEHRFMLRDGSYKEAQFLKPDDALMPFTSKKLKNYKTMDSKWHTKNISKVSQLVFTSDVIRAYDITVERYHNFAVMSESPEKQMKNCCFVHNSEFSEMQYCLHPDTKIAIPGGYKTIKELADEYGTDKQFIVYSYDHNLKQIVPAFAKQARMTKVADCYKVTFDNGKEIIGSSNHRLMKRDGVYCEISDLKEGTAMMPFYRKSFFSTNETKEEETGEYLSIYTMDKGKRNGWHSEHRLIAEWAYRKLEKNEVVHHIDFCRSNNDPSNLKIMTDHDHKSYHAEFLNGKKWNTEINSEWIEKFKKQHSEWMKENNPNKRNDITFAKILQFAQENGFNLYKIASAFDANLNVIKMRLRENGFDNFITFAQAYNKDWVPGYTCDNSGENNGRFNPEITFSKICDLYKKGITCKALSKQLGVSITPVVNRIKENGYESWSDFCKRYENLKVAKVEFYGNMPLYDLTVDGYKNFATDSVISHNTAEIAAALDIYADESAGSDENGRSLHIFSDNPEVRRALEELFYEVANVELDLRRWVRNLCMYGDSFLYAEVQPEEGVVNLEVIPTNIIEREEMFDPTDPYAVRFKLLTHGGKILENWQVVHFRIQGNELFHPYGTSFLEPIRRTWRQLVMLEDAMLVYRIVRSPERRVFYIDVSGIQPNDIPSYMEAVKETIKGKDVIDRMSGRMDLRYNPVDVNEDYFLPARPNSQTKIDTLAGGQHVSATEDVEYIQRKMIAGLKVPRAYLTFDDSLSCLTGDTLIPLLDGTEVSMKELAERFDRGELKDTWCYSSKPDGTIVPGKIKKAWKTKEANVIYKVKLDNGEIVECTENHPFLLRNGTYKRADQLSVNDSLMPVYRKISSKAQGDVLEGYEMVLNNSTGRWEYTHRIANAEAARRLGGHTIGKGRVIHHKDFNKLNNSLENLEEMTWRAHRKYHSEHLETTLLRPDVIEKREPIRIAALRAPKHRQLKSVQMQKQMDDPNSSLRAWIHGDDIKDIVSNNMTEMWKDEEYRALKTAQNKEILTRPEVREKLFGDNHWARRKNEEYDLQWLINFCKENNITRFSDFKSAKKIGSAIGTDAVKHLFKINGVPSWKDFLKNYVFINHKVVSIEIVKYENAASTETATPVVTPSEEIVSCDNMSSTETEASVVTPYTEIGRCDNTPSVFDLEIEETHNFLVKQGIVVHNSKAGLAQEDIRFSRTIGSLQKIIVAELSKLAIVHLFAKGFEGEDLLDFEIRLSNPSTIAVQQKLQLLTTRLEAAGKAQDLAKESAILSEEWIQKNILGLRMDEIIEIRAQRFEEQMRNLKLTKMALPTTDMDEKTIVDPFDQSNYNIIGGKRIAAANGDGNNPYSTDNGSKTTKSGLKLPEPGNQTFNTSMDVKKPPVRANPRPNLDASQKKRNRRVTHSGNAALSMPDFKKMLDVDNRYTKDPFDTEFLKNPLLEFSSRNKAKALPHLSKEMYSMLKRFDESYKKNTEMIDVEFITEGNDDEKVDLAEIESELFENKK